MGVPPGARRFRPQPTRVARKPADPRQLRHRQGAGVRLPLGLDSGPLDEAMVDSLELVDHSALDWRRVTSTACLVHQRVTYTYEGPVGRLRQPPLVQPRGAGAHPAG